MTDKFGQLKMEVQYGIWVTAVILCGVILLATVVRLFCN